MSRSTRVAAHTGAHAAAEQQRRRKLPALGPAITGEAARILSGYFDNRGYLG